MKAIQKIICITLSCLIVLSLAPASYALTIHEFPQDFYLSQNERDTCTLCSATMMIRSALYQKNDARWSEVTEAKLRPVAWWKNDGLLHTFSYALDDTFINVNFQHTVNGISAASLKQVLNQHPEGIALYCGKAPHAVFLIGYEGDTFYCAETAQGYSGKAIPLSSSTLGRRYGSQNDILKNVTGYWYVSSCTRIHEFTQCGCGQSKAGLYVNTASSTTLKIRSGHGTQYSIIGEIPPGANVNVLGASNGWAHISYNDIEGFSSMNYLKLKPCNHTYHVEIVKPTCLTEGYTKRTCTKCHYSFRDEYTTSDTHEYNTWTKKPSGSYTSSCDICGAPTEQIPLIGTVTADALRIREQAGTSYKTLGYLSQNTKVEIVEQKQVGSMTWGRIQNGWISMSYIKLETTATQPPVPTSRKGTITAHCLRIRANAGTQHAIVGFLYYGNQVEVLEQTMVGTTAWGRIQGGWISMDYVQLDDEPQPKLIGVVTCDSLRIRAGAGTTYQTVGYLLQGAKIEILEQKQVGNSTWARTKDGWVSMAYIKVMP